MSELPGIVVTGVSGRMGQMLARAVLASDRVLANYLEALDPNEVTSEVRKLLLQLLPERIDRELKWVVL